MALFIYKEFNDVKYSAEENRMVINIHKTKEIVFKRPNPRLYTNRVPISAVQHLLSY